MEERQRMLDERAQREADIRIALLGEQRADMVRGRERDQAVDIMSAGPGAVLDPAAAETARKFFPSRVTPGNEFETEALPGMIPGTMTQPGAKIIPTFLEQAQMDTQAQQKTLGGLQIADLQANQADRGKRDAARAFVASDKFLAAPPESKQRAWAEAGYDGEAPLSFNDRKIFLDYQHEKEMEKVRAQIAGQKEVAQLRTGLTPQRKLSMGLQLRKQYDKETASAQELNKQFGRMTAGIDAIIQNNAWNPGSQSILVTFQKILDEDSVVRESEYARSEQGLALKDRLRGLMLRMGEGGPGVPKEQLQEFVAVAEAFVRGAYESAMEKKSMFEGFAQDYQLDPRLITGGINIGGGQPGGGVQPPPAAPVQPTNPPPAGGGKFTVIGVQ